LPAAGKSEEWVERYLKKQNLDIQDVWLLTVDSNEKTVLIKKEGA
jgi:hypothetical protein